MTWLWLLAVLAPAGTASALALAALRPPGDRTRRRLVRAAPVSLLPAAALAVAGPAAGDLDLPWLLLGTSATLDQVGRPLLLTAAVLYAATLATAAHARGGRAAVLAALLLTCFVGNATAFVAADAATFTVGYAVMSVAAYGLVAHDRTAAARRAGRAYLTLGVVSEVAVLAAVVLVVSAGGLRLADAPAAVAASPHTGTIVGLLLLGFGIKAGLVPLHGWLPLAHPAAPPPASAVLSGAMVKAGLVGWLRFLPLGEVALPGWGTALVLLALVGAFGALVPGVLARDPKVALAYSSVSQMGFLAVLVGVALVAPDLAPACVLAAVVYAVHHGIAKGGLFLSVAVWRRHGAGRWRGLVVAGTAVLALAVAGAPLGSGSVAKYAAKQAVAPAPLLVDVTALLPLVGTVSTLLLARAAVRLLAGPEPGRDGLDAPLVTWAVLVLGGTVATWWLADRWAPVLRVPRLDAVTLWDAAWPVLLGVALAGAAVVAARTGRLPQRVATGEPEPVVPAGDVLVPVERATGALLAALPAAGDRVAEVRDRAQAAVVRTAHALGRAHRVERAEARLSGWVPSGVALLAVAAVAGVALAVTP